MRKSKNNDKTWLNPFWVVMFGLVLAIAATFAPFLVFPDPDPSINWVRARTFLSIITIPIVLTGFVYTSVQFRKAMAKPILSLVFTEDGKLEQNITLYRDSPQGTETRHQLSLSILNTGNAIARVFQIVFFIPNILKPRFEALQQLSHGISQAELPPKFTIDERLHQISVLADDDYLLFVKNPQKFCTLSIVLLSENYDKYPNEFIVNYTVYSSWSEPQDGKLKVIINKQDAPHVA
jgi:hypothetical protein